MSIEAPRFPLDFGEKSGFSNVNNIKELVRFHLTNLLLTNKGERIHDLEYGVGMKRFLFEMVDDVVKSEIEAEISDQINIHLDYLQVQNISILDSEEDPNIPENTINISIFYDIQGTRESDVLSLDLNVGESGLDESIAY